MKEGHRPGKFKRVFVATALVAGGVGAGGAAVEGQASFQSRNRASNEFSIMNLLSQANTTIVTGPTNEKIGGLPFPSGHKEPDLQIAGHHLDQAGAALPQQEENGELNKERKTLARISGDLKAGEMPPGTLKKIQGFALEHNKKRVKFSQDARRERDWAIKFGLVPVSELILGLVFLVGKKIGRIHKAKNHAEKNEGEKDKVEDEVHAMIASPEDDQTQLMSRAGIDL